MFEPKPRMGAVVYALDLDRLSRFYAEVARLEPVEVTDSYAVLEAATWQLVVVAVPETIAVTIRVETPPVPRDDTAVKLSLPVKSIAQARALALRLGGSLNDDDRVWAFRGDLVCDGVDPEGNVFQVREPQ